MLKGNAHGIDRMAWTRIMRRCWCMKESPGYGVEGKKKASVKGAEASDNHVPTLPTIKPQNGLMWLQGWYIFP